MNPRIPFATQARALSLSTEIKRLRAENDALRRALEGVLRIADGSEPCVGSAFEAKLAAAEAALSLASATPPNRIAGPLELSGAAVERDRAVKELGSDHGD